MSDTQRQDLEDLDDVLGSELENEGDDEELTSSPRRGRKPKNKALNVLNHINDPFEYALAWLVACPTEPIKMIIRRGGAILTILDYSDDRGKIKINSLSQVQSDLGAGTFTFEIISTKTQRPVREPFSETLLTPPTFSKNIEQASKADSNPSSEDRLLKMVELLASQKSSSQDQQIPTSQLSLVDQLAKLAPVIPVIIEGIKALKGPEQPKGMSTEEMLLKMREIAKQEREELEERERRIKEEVEERLEEEKERRGLAPDKSILEQIVEGFGSVSKMVQAQAKVKEMEVKQRRSPAPVKKLTQQVPQKLVQVLPAKESIENYDDLLGRMMARFSELDGDEQKCIAFVKDDAECMELIRKYDVNTVCARVHKLLGLDEEIVMIRSGLEKVYADCLR